MSGNGTFTNTATANATDSNGKPIISPEAQATIHVNKPLGAPEKHKRIKKNGDGTYTLNVDVKGAASAPRSPPPSRSTSRWCWTFPVRWMNRWAQTIVLNG